MVGVHPGYTGQGIAKTLTQTCLEKAKDLNEKTIALHTSELMDAARHIYESPGFTILKEIPNRFGKRYWLYTLNITSTNIKEMTNENNLRRFLDAQQADYSAALAEIKNGRKRSHWMWYIFPQILGLGFSETSKFYAIKDINEAEEFLSHPVLGSRLIEISNELLKLESNNANTIFGSPDDVKLKSSMTLFASVHNADPVFQLVLERFFNGTKDTTTLAIIERQQ
ncbi:MAG: hypothetical protein JWQ40_3479 [Segetibacter sp.]|nr:hypothetical protein [Segetibacter sp.]